MKIGEVSATSPGWVIEVHRKEDHIQLLNRNVAEPHRLGSSIDIPLQWTAMDLAQLIMKARYS